MRILKLSGYFYPEQISSSHLSKDLNEAYLNAGFTFVNYVPTPTRGISEEVRKEYKSIKYEELDDGKVIVHRFSMFREGKNPIQRAIRYALVNFIQYFKGSSAENIDLILSGSTPPTQGLLCGMVKKKLSKRYKKRVPVVYNLQDIFPDSLVNAKMTRKGSLIWKIGRKIEDFGYRHADKIIVISEEFKRNIMEKGVPEDKMVIIPNWVNTESVYPVAREDNILFERYSLDRNKFYICYSGNIGHSQNLPMLLETAKRLAIELPEVQFVLIGEGAAKEEFVNKVDEEKLDNITILPFQDYEDIAHVFSLGDVGLIMSKPGIGKSSVPSKTWSIMAAERPVLASFDEDSELSKLVNENEYGIAVDAGDVDKLCQAIRTLYKDSKRVKDMGQQARKYVVEQLNKDKCTAMYVDTIRNVMKGE